MSTQPHPEHHRAHLVKWTLRFGVILMCIGIAWHDYVREDPIFEYLFVLRKVDEGTALRFVHAGCLALLASIPFVCFDRGWPVLLLISFWIGLRTVTHGLDDVWHPELIPLENAVRILGPLALAGIVAFRSPDSSVRSRMQWIDPVLRIATALTFIGHGLAALFLKGQFIDFLLDASHDIVGIGITQSTAEILLLGIGTLDLIVAFLVLLPFRFRWVVAWMAFWGLLTSFARMTRYGQQGIPLALLRALNWAAPLALFFYWQEVEESESP